MDIVGKKLTLTENAGAHTVNCVAGCRVKLNAGETASLLAPGAKGFRLSCVLLGVDKAPNPDDTLFTYNKSKTFKNIVDILDVNQVFEADVGKSLLNEDTTGNKRDEIRARFTLINLTTGASRSERSPRVIRDFG
jgi:hypothetical protein